MARQLSETSALLETVRNELHESGRKRQREEARLQEVESQLAMVQKERDTLQVRLVVTSSVLNYSHVICATRGYTCTCNHMISLFNFEFLTKRFEVRDHYLKVFLRSSIFRLQSKVEDLVTDIRNSSQRFSSPTSDSRMRDRISALESETERLHASLEMQRRLREKAEQQSEERLAKLLKAKDAQKSLESHLKLLKQSYDKCFGDSCYF